MRQSLPIDTVLPELAQALSETGAAVLIAPTGAGKTTRVPPMLAALDGVDGEVWLLQPRRVAARAAARRMAAEDGSRTGDRVGYIVRGESRVSSATRVVVMTEGVAVRRLQDDPFASGVSAVVLDEFHERSADADLVFSMVREVRAAGRDDLRFVVMSATLDAERVADALDGAPIVRSEGRTHPVDVSYADSDTDDVTRAVVRAVRAQWSRHAGHTLVFLPGVREINACADAFEGIRHQFDPPFEVRPLHGTLPPDAQDEAIAPGSTRRIILATNIAETSLTVPGVTCVVDSGLERVMRYDPGAGMNRLELGRISRASADQRAGRAGRERPGVCVRLWSEATHRTLRAEREPEIARIELSGVVLQVAAWGCVDPTTFAWFEPPPTRALDDAVELLRVLGALDGGQLSPAGRALARLPLSPRIARLVMAASELGATRVGAVAAAVLEARDIVRRDARSDAGRAADTGSDLLDLVAAVEGRPGRWRRSDLVGPRVARVRDDAARIAAIVGGRSDGGDTAEALGRALLAGFPDRVARRRDDGDRAVMVGGRGVRLSRESAVQSARLFVCAELDAGRRGARAESWVHIASAVDEAWLDGGLITETRDVRVDGATGVVTAWRCRRYLDLELDRSQTAVTDDEAAAALLAAVGDDVEGALGLIDEPVGGWWWRARAVARWRPELELEQALDDAARQVLSWRARKARRVSALSDGSAASKVRELLPWDVAQRIEQLAPTSVTVPSGRALRLDYSDADRPVLAVKLQEMFGCADTPTVDEGRRRVVLHLLAPNGRPAQVTDDLRSFWDNTYPEVRRDLRARYAKHPWPEDPWTAPATARTKRRS